MKNKKPPYILITGFVILWTIIFHYESIRYFYLERRVGHPLPKVKFLFPPAGWIMFYNVDPSSGYVEVFGVKEGAPQVIDPHDIFRTRTIMFDNIHRNILSTVASPYTAKDFCRFLEWRFPYFDDFMITAVYYPDVVKGPHQRYQQLKYRCKE